MASIAHGGKLSEARRLFPDAPEPWLDLSTGINPDAYPLPALALECFARLPDPEDLDRLLSAAADAYHVRDRAMLAAAPGTQILIELLPKLWPEPSVRILGPTYTEHARAWARAGIKTSEVTSFEALSEANVAVLCNPNNPDGRRFAPEHLLRLADRLAEHRGLLVVDEAFADLEDDRLSLAPALPHPSLIVLRSFGKTYGLAGLRLGFALGAPDRILRIRDSLGPWAVSGPAIAVGQQALRDQAWLTMTRERLAHRREELDAVLSDRGLNVVGGTRLFRLIVTENAPALFAQLGGAGIFVRRFAGQPRWLRLGQPGSDANVERLKAALRRP